jgi:hypothetical protein
VYARSFLFQGLFGNSRRHPNSLNFDNFSTRPGGASAAAAAAAVAGTGAAAGLGASASASANACSSDGKSLAGTLVNVEAHLPPSNRNDQVAVVESDFTTPNTIAASSSAPASVLATTFTTTTATDTLSDFSSSVHIRIFVCLCACVYVYGTILSVL